MNSLSFFRFCLIWAFSDVARQAYPFWGVLWPALRGKYIFEKHTPKQIGDFPDLWPNLRPALVPLASGRGDVEFACVLASVASVVFSFVSELICWNVAQKANRKPSMAN